MEAAMQKKARDAGSSVQNGPIRDENVLILDNFQGHVENEDRTHFKKEMGWLSSLAAGADAIGGWITFPSVLLVTFVYGGAVPTIWGIVIVGIIFVPIAITIAELVSVYPTVGGQYHWAGILAPKKYRREISYACGMLSWFSWLAITAGGCSAISNYIPAFIRFYHPTFTVQKWLIWIIFETGNISYFLINAYCSRILPFVYKAGFAFSCFAAFFIFVATLASAEKQSSDFVWTQVENISGWPNGMQFLISLGGPTVIFCAIDGVVHLVEDTKQPTKVVPRAVISSLVISVVITLAFAIGTMYCIGDFEAALGSITGFPIFEIWRQAMRSDAWAVAFMSFLLVMTTPACLPLVQIVSRMTWSLASDNGLFFSKWLKHVDEKRKVPIRALLFNTVIIFLIGILYLISFTAYGAILSISVVFQQVTLAIPSALLIYRKRDPKYLPPNRPFRVPNAVGWACNIISVVYAVFALVFFQFPYTSEVTLASMNYACLVIGVSSVCGYLTWVFWAKKHYTPPSVILASVAHIEP